jgi:pyridoxamine 5'-phosphate oxidase
VVDRKLDGMEFRDRLRAIPVFPDDLPTFDASRAPSDPHALFADWLDAAVSAGQAAAHVMTLSTLTAAGALSARNLILKDLDERGWQFATHSTSPKAQDLAATPQAALTFFWPAVGRQVRVSGTVVALPEDEAAADFRARPLGSRAATLAGHQSEVLADPADLDRAISEAAESLRREPALVDEAWSLYAVDADRVEFWQASHDRTHTRLLYCRERATRQGQWQRQLLWP